MGLVRSLQPLPVPVPDTQTAADGWRPLVSVIVVARNEEANIGPCLEGILSQDYPHDRLEVLVLDGMSEDRTRDVVAGYTHRGVSIRVLPNPVKQRAHGLNLGIRAARGEVICRIDARTRITPTYVSSCLRTMRAAGAEAVGAAMRPIAETATQEAIGLAMSHPFGVGDAQFRLGKKSGFVDTIYLGLYRREVFDRVGLFDDAAPVISEDTELHYRLRRGGGKIYLDSGISVFYAPREALRDLARLYFRYGGARAGYVLKHRRFGSWRRLVPPALVLALVGLSIGALVDQRLLWPLAALVGTYLASTIGVSSMLAIRRRNAALLGRLCLAFPCMHLAYGYGLWHRLLQRPKPGTYWGY